MTETLRGTMSVAIFGDRLPVHNEKVSQCPGIGASLYVVRYDCIFLVVQFRSLSRLPPPLCSSPAFRRLEHRAAETRGRLSIRLSRRKSNDNASTKPSRPRCDFQGDFFTLNTPGDVCLSATGRSRAKGQMRIDHDAIESAILSSVKDYIFFKRTIIYTYIYIYIDFSEWFRVEKLTRLYIFSIRICEFFPRNRKFVLLSEPQSNEWHDEFMSRGCFIDCYEWKLFAVMKVAGV